MKQPKPPFRTTHTVQFQQRGTREVITVDVFMRNISADEQLMSGLSLQTLKKVTWSLSNTFSNGRPPNEGDTIMYPIYPGGRTISAQISRPEYRGLPWPTFTSILKEQGDA